MAVKLRYWLARVISSDVGIFETQGDWSIAALSLLIAKKSEYLSPIYLNRSWKASVCVGLHICVRVYESEFHRAKGHRAKQASWDGVWVEGLLSI